MANVVYPLAKQAFLSAGLDLTSVTLKAVLVDTGAYTYSASHANLSDIPAPARIATSGALASKTVANGVFDAADVSIPNVVGATVEAIVIYKDTGTASTSSLVAYIDTGSGLPYTPNSAQVDIAWDNSASKIFAL
ncbi:hypothetical protein [Embleya sp. NPDC059237]|uniref:hypothetical protein n=1 Tax=Embleya sp. NPDC059237 TaxID=3346784 RepID=UPI00369C6DAA